MHRILGIYVKHPQPGQVKTRLAEVVGGERAAEVYRAFLSDTIERFRHTADRRFLCFSPNTPEAEAWFRERAGTDYELWPQPEGTLEPRLREFFEFAAQNGAGGTVVIGSDSPTLPLSFVEQAFQSLESCDAVIGPAMDGGYYLLGLQKPFPIFEGIDWSSSRVLGQTAGRLARIKASLKLLPPWYDVDTPMDLQVLRGHVAALVLSRDPVISSLVCTREVLANPKR